MKQCLSCNKGFEELLPTKITNHPILFGGICRYCTEYDKKMLKSFLTAQKLLEKKLGVSV